LSATISVPYNKNSDKSEAVIPTLLNYQYRMYPDTNQKLELNEWLRTCQYWYNRQLGERFTWCQDNNLQLKSFPWWKDIFPPLFDTKPDYYNQKAQLPTLKKAEGRRQKAEGFVQKGIQTPNVRGRLNRRLSRGLNPCTRVVARDGSGTSVKE